LGLGPGEAGLGNEWPMEGVGGAVGGGGGGGADTRGGRVVVGVEDAKFFEALTASNKHDILQT